jgi:hypothetical protein
VLKKYSLRASEKKNTNVSKKEADYQKVQIHMKGNHGDTQ